MHLSADTFFVNIFNKRGIWFGLTRFWNKTLIYDLFIKMVLISVEAFKWIKINLGKDYAANYVNRWTLLWSANEAET